MSEMGLLVTVEQVSISSRDGFPQRSHIHANANRELSATTKQAARTFAIPGRKISSSTSMLVAETGVPEPDRQRDCLNPVRGGHHRRAGEFDHRIRKLISV